MNQATTDKPICSDHKADVSVYMRLREALVREEVDMVIETILEAHDLAIQRDTDQRVVLRFNAKGYLVKVDGANGRRPRVYKPE